MGGIAHSSSTYAIVGKSERLYTSDIYMNSTLRTKNYDVFVRMIDETFEDNVSDILGESRIDESTGEIVDQHVIWLTDCDETENTGQVKIVTLEDGSYCVLWERFVNGDFDSIRYVIIDECGKILRSESEIRNGRLSSTSVQPYVQGDNLTWTVADDNKKCITWYTVNLNEPKISTDIIGDINNDGVFNVSDVVLLQKWLLAVPNTNLANWKNGDIISDGKLDVFDLCLMKRTLIQQQN